MKRTHRKWTSLFLVIALLFGLLPPYAADAAAARITITNLYTDTNSSTNRPVNDADVIRFTSNPITVTATIENISDSQLPNLYYEITNVSSNTTVVEKNVKAQKTGQFDIAFNNVYLTEGLNRITIKLGDTSVVSSAPGWAYFTATTNIQDLKINGVPFEDGKMYPENPGQSTTVTITGKAPNATEVQAYLLGDPSPKSAYFTNGDFMFIADDIHKTNSTATFKLTPGDNYLKFIAVNNSKTYQTEKNLIYDNGKPFAFGATIKEQTGSVTKKLVETPTVTSPNVEISALLKTDLNSVGDLQYRYVDVTIGGQKYGPFDLSSAKAAARATDISPKTVYEGHSDIYVSVIGTGLDDSVKVDIKDKSGTDVAVGLSRDTTYSDSNVSLYKITQAMALKEGDASSGGPYSFIVKKGSEILNQFAIQVVKPTSALPQVNNAATTISGLKEGYGANQKQVVLTSGVANEPDVQVEILDRQGLNRLGQAFGIDAPGNNAAINYDMPLNLVQGKYKARISYQGFLLSEFPFQIDRPDPQLPTVSTVLPGITNFSAAHPGKVAPTYLVVEGQNLGTKITDILNDAALGIYDSSGTKVNSVNLTPYDVRNNYVIFKLDDQSQLPAGNYSIKFNKEVYDANGVKFTTQLVSTVTGSVYSASAGAGYAGPVITSINGDTKVQFSQTDQNKQITLAGANLTDAATKLLVEILNEDGKVPLNTGTVKTATSTSATVQIPNMNAGNYLLRFTYDNTTVLGVFPMTIAYPAAANLSVSKIGAQTVMTVTGTNFGMDPNKLKLKLVSDDNPSVIVGPLSPAANSLEAGSKVQFILPTMTEGTYSVSLMYGSEEYGAPLKYTVTSPATLTENAAWSKDGKYKVFEFTTKLTIPSDKYQLVQFRFFNSDLDDVPPSTFSFNYQDPNLPYVDHVNRVIGTSEVLISEKGVNEINELPATFKIYTDLKATGVNVYVGQYSSNATPYKKLTVTTQGSYKVATLTLQGLPNGATKLTVVPVLGNSENVAGKKQYDLVLSSTPYVIVHNIYDGMIIKNENTDIYCKDNNLSSCVSGKLVNVPMSGAAIDPSAKVEVYVNEIKTANPISTQADGSFYVQIGALKEGKNTIKFLIYLNGKLVTETKYEIFKFSTDAPEIISIKPVEKTDVVKYVPEQAPDTYSTNEKTVSFSGQFANASEIKLTVRTKDENGNPVVKYDRRFGSGFNSIDPISGNPNYFAKVNSPAGHFTTKDIPLAATGDTIFEFSITNSSNITVSKTITVTREPLPYVILYPILIKNEKGEYQANINSNFVEIEMEAENADSVVFGKTNAVKREVTDSDGNKKIHFFYEASNLKPGKNQIKFTVVRGTVKTNGSFTLFNVDTPIEGAQYKTPLKSSMKVLGGEVELSFPKGTYLMRNDPSAVNQYLSGDRKILFGIANNEDGRVDKYKHPAASDGQIGNPNPLISPDAKLLLTEPTGRFRPAGKLIWIDAGTISKNESDLNKALNGSGRLPYDQETFYNRNLEDLVVPTKNGKLTLKYDPNIRTDAWKYVTVYHFDIYEDYRGIVQPRWKNIGGVVDPKKHTITVPLERFGYYQVMYMDKSFDDITAHPWARHDLDTLYAKGIMLNKTSSAFVPNDPISRGEFATMLVKIFDIPLQYTETPTFTDVLRVNPLTNGLYDYKYIETAAKVGIVRGASGGRFMPDSAITRQDAAVMIARAANLKLGNDTDKSLKALQKMFTDAGGIDIYARTAVEAVAKAGFIKGIENVLSPGQKKKTFRFDPKETLTRAEAAAVAISVMKQQKKIPK